MKYGKRILASAGALAAATGGLIAYATKVEPRALSTRHVVIGIPGLAAPLEGLSLAFLTDFHVNGPGYGDELTREAIDIVAAEQPDLVLLGGDYFDNANPGSDPRAFDGLRQFEHCFAILGNHDHRRGEAGVQRTIELLEAYGVCVLRNETTNVRVRDRNISIAGVDDPYLGKADLNATLAGQPDPDGPLVLLAHAPSIIPHLPIGAARLILCGHTHGGQIRLSPWQRLTPLDSSWYLDRLYGRPKSDPQRGFHWICGSLLYVANGIGTTRLGARFMAPPEITFIHLTSTEPNPDAPCDSAERYVEAVN